jgi:DnaJ-class molecular chaperone
MALLLRWLHPDVDPQGERAVFTQKVTRAWSDLKTDESRAAYDMWKQISGTKRGDAKKSAGSKKASANSRHPHYRKPHQKGSVRRAVDIGPVDLGILRRMLHLLLGRVAQ